MKTVKSLNILFISIILFCAVAISCSKDNEPNVDNENKEVFDFAWVERDSIWNKYPDSNMVVLDVDSNRQVFTEGTYLSFSGEDNHAKLTVLVFDNNTNFWLTSTFNTMVTDTFNIWHIDYRNKKNNIQFTNSPNLIASWKTRKFQIIKTEGARDSLFVEAAFHVKINSTDPNIKDIRGAFRYYGIKMNGIVGDL